MLPVERNCLNCFTTLLDNIDTKDKTTKTTATPLNTNTPTDIAQALLQLPPTSGIGVPGNYTSLSPEILHPKIIEKNLTTFQSELSLQVGKCNNC